MRKLALASLAMCAIATSFSVPAAQASPPVPGPDGAKCSYTAVSDPAPDADPDAMTGEVRGGPLVWDRPFVMYCSLQIDDPVYNGQSNDVWHETAPSTPVGPAHVAIMDPRTVNYDSPADSQDYLCTTVRYSGGTLYWVSSTDPDGIPQSGDETAGYWTADPNRHCAAATQFSTEPIIDAVNDVVEEFVDPTLCEVILKPLHPFTPLLPSPLPTVLYIDSEGDVFIDDGDGSINDADWQSDMFWDCQTYVGDFNDPTGGPDGADDGVVD